MVTIPSLRAPLGTISRAPNHRPNNVVYFDPFRLGGWGSEIFIFYPIFMSLRGALRLGMVTTCLPKARDGHHMSA